MSGKLSALSVSFNEASQRMRLEHQRSGLSAALTMPVFEIEGQNRRLYHLIGQSGIRALSNGAQEQIWTFEGEGGLKLEMVFRGYPTSPVLRLKYRLFADQQVRMTRSGGEDQIEYFRLSAAHLGEMDLTEYQLSHFDPVAHSYMPYRLNLSCEAVLPGLDFAGPVALFHSRGETLLAAYEHGADHPDLFLRFRVEGQGPERCLVVCAARANYYDGKAVGPEQAWESVWFEMALFPAGIEAFLPVYRRFFLDEVCINPQSRQPYIFYNTWNYQERQKYFHNRPFLADMNAGRMLSEIEVAHRLGVEVFVIDTGWYIKTGDWLPNTERFPEGLKEIKRALDRYGMKLGLWFNPTAAALTSRIFKENPEYEMEWQGKPRWRGPVWETETSTNMCLASGYAEDFIETMVRLNRELGVSYFKWDAVSQYGCDSALHNHGTELNAREERAECYAFESGRAMIHIVEEVSRRCPDVIVDFDVTEGGRFVGLGFLSVGKFFLINNGPYFHDFDIPRSVKIDPDTINVFFYPGAARPRVCRQGAKYDPVIPSILFLTHYLPDGPQLSQANSIAALVLGGNGFWGDLPALSEEDVLFLGDQIDLYKRVRRAVTRAYPLVTGFAGSSPEIHEKIDPAQGSGLVAFFTVTPGRVVHYTQKLDAAQIEQVEGADEWEVTPDGRLKLCLNLERNDARVVYVIPKGSTEAL